MSFIKDYIAQSLKETATGGINPLDEIKDNRYFKYMATSFSIAEKEELFDYLSKLYADYPVLNEYEITLIGIGAVSAGEVTIDKKRATIKLGDRSSVSTVIHEMGHIIARTVNYSNLDLSRANEYEVSVYALTSKEEMFCELVSNRYCSRDRYKVRVAKELLGELR